MPRPTFHLALAALAALALAPAPARAAGAPVELTLVSYAVAKPLFAKLIPEFQKSWREQTGTVGILTVVIDAPWRRRRSA